MSSAVSSSILATVTPTAPNRGIPPWNWKNKHIAAFHCNFVVGNFNDLPLSSEATADFHISYASLEMLHLDLQWRTPCEHVSHALCPGIPNGRGSGISTNPFADTPLLLRFGKAGVIMPADCVIAKSGVPLVAYNTAANFHQVSQMFKDPKDVECYTGGELKDEVVRAMNMAVIIALAQRQAVAVKLGCIENRDVFVVGAIYIPEKARTIDIYTSKVTREYLQDLKHPERALTKQLTITKTQLDFVADEVKGITDCLRFIMASVSNIGVLKPMENVGESVKLRTYRLD